MPELPEVETVKNGLRELLKLDKASCVIKRAELLRKDIREEIPTIITKRTKNQPLLKIKRKAKYLLFEFHTGTLINHLGMTGSWRFCKTRKEVKLHDHFVLHLASGGLLAFNDPRRFGLVSWIEIGELSPRLEILGPEPLEKEFDAEYLWAKAKKSQAPIKNFLMNQKVVVGVGNIYASEALYLSQIKPQKRSAKVTKKECEELTRNIKKVLRIAIEAGGSTISDFKQAGGESGYFQHQFKVYGRENQPCKNCEAKIKMKVIGGRSSFYCPQCQK